MLFHKTLKAVQPDWQSGLFSNNVTQNPVTVEAESSSNHRALPQRDFHQGCQDTLRTVTVLLKIVCHYYHSSYLTADQLPCGHSHRKEQSLPTRSLLNRFPCELKENLTSLPFH